MSVKKRLAAKQRRVLEVPVQVSEPGPARARLEEASKALVMAEFSKRPEEELEPLRAAKAAAEAALEECFERVQFGSLLPADMERLVAAHTKPDGETDDVTLTPVLAAACATDSDLQDEEWWTQQLISGSWSYGERADLYTQLIALNYDTSAPSAPKG